MFHYIDFITSKYGKLDAAFNNAGVDIEDSKLADGNIDTYNKIMDVNVKGVWLCMQKEIQLMLQSGGGAIVNTASIAGLGAAPTMSIYSASKHAVIGLTKSAAIEYAKKNINVNCISPGFIKTAMTDKIDEKFKEVIVSKIPSARLGEPDDIANAVLFLSSDQSNYINGETIHVNGGMYMA